jgi:hypothetical protein
VPDAVGANHVATLVDEDVEGQSGLLDEPPYALARLPDDSGQLEAAGLVLWEIMRELTEPVAAVRSTGAAMKGEQQRSARQELDERSRPPLLIRQQEPRRALQR